MESTEISTKSSNEILTELFGAFNAEPPKINEKTKRRSSSEGTNSKHSKKSKKNKSKKSKKKHKSKTKKHKRKRPEDGNSESGSIKSGKKKQKSKEKKSKKRHSSPNSVNIELPVNKVPMALEIMLDGTVGIKGEDGVMTKIPDMCESDKVECEPEAPGIEAGVNGDVAGNEEVNEVTKEEIKSSTDKTDENTEIPSDSKIPEIFETKATDSGDKQTKRKIKIKDLKFSSVFQETVKAVEEQKKKEEEKKANIEEGELSDSSNDEHDLKNKPEEKSVSKPDKEHSHHKRRNHSRSHHRRDELEHSRKRKRSRSRSRSSHHRSHTRHRSHDRFSHKRHRSRSRDHYSSHHVRRHSPSLVRSHYSRSRDRHRSRTRSRSHRSRSRSIDRRKSRSSHRSKSGEVKHHSKAKSKDRSESVEKIDKEKLLAIARKNALKLIDAGVVPGAEKLTTIKAGGKTVNELTEYCKKLSEKEALGDDVSDIVSESSEDEEKPFHHPFQVRDRPSSIIMNIKNSIPLPVKSLQEKAAEQAKQLRLQFPVSSGSSHRRTESEWVPVSPPKKEEPSVMKQPVAPPPPIERPPLPPPPQPSLPMYFSAVPPPEIPNKPVFPVIQPNPPLSKLDISSIVSKRLEAIRKLQENPNDPHALNQMYSAQQEMQYWAESKQETGAFTGSTGAKILSASELSSGAQAWAKRVQKPSGAEKEFFSLGCEPLALNLCGKSRCQSCVIRVVVDEILRRLRRQGVAAGGTVTRNTLDQLTSATPVKGGMGMALLQKMGWQPGEGLGKNKEGTLEPLKLEVKMDKKGLLAPDESRKSKKGGNNQQGPPLPTVKTLDGKHPVSLLNELCSRRRYGVPQFELCFECGPDHKKNFLFKVKVNGMEYTPRVASPNKKQAKAEAAAICLRALGIIPVNPQN